MRIFIRTRHVYLDRKSKKKKLKKESLPKPKYKLASLQSTVSKGHYFFIIGSDRPQYIPEDCIIEVFQKDWERKLKNHLTKPCSYIDLINTEFITYTDIEEKMLDKENGFSCIGLIKKVKFQEINKLYPEVLKDRITKNKKRKKILSRATISAGRERLKNLGLKYIE